MISQTASAAPSNHRTIAFLAVATLHLAAGYAFYSGLMTRVPIHVPTIFEWVPTQQPTRPASPPMARHDPTLTQPTLFVPDPEYARIEAGDNEGPQHVGSTPLRPDSNDTSSTHSFSAASYDASHPFKVGEDYYPPGAVRLGEEGRCGVQVTVAPDGRITAASLARSTGHRLLDEACLTAVNGQRMRPAIQNGKAVESRVIVPIVWKLTAR